MSVKTSIVIVYDYDSERSINSVVSGLQNLNSLFVSLEIFCFVLCHSIVFILSDFGPLLVFSSDLIEFIYSNNDTTWCVLVRCEGHSHPHDSTYAFNYSHWKRIIPWCNHITLSLLHFFAQNRISLLCVCPIQYLWFYIIWSLWIAVKGTRHRDLFVHRTPLYHFHRRFINKKYTHAKRIRRLHFYILHWFFSCRFKIFHVIFRRKLDFNHVVRVTHIVQ